MNALFYIKRYFQEFLEAVLAILVVKILTSQDVTKSEVILTIAKISMVVGGITFILEEINPKVSESVKRNIVFAAK